MGMYIVRGLSFRSCFRLLTIWFSLDHKWRWKEMETFWFFVHWFPRTLDCAYDSNFLFLRVIGALMTLLTIPTLTPSLVKTSLIFSDLWKHIQKMNEYKLYKNQGLYKRYISSYQKTPSLNWFDSFLPYK